MTQKSLKEQKNGVICPKKNKRKCKQATFCFSHPTTALPLIYQPWYVCTRITLLLTAISICLLNIIYCICIVILLHLAMWDSDRFCMYICMYVCAYVCTHVCMHICMYLCVYVCTYVCMCVYVCIYLSIHARMHTKSVTVSHDTFMFVCMYVCTYVRTYVPVLHFFWLGLIRKDNFPSIV